MVINDTIGRSRVDNALQRLDDLRSAYTVEFGNHEAVLNLLIRDLQRATVELRAAVEQERSNRFQ